MATQAENVIALEKIMKKVLRKAFKDTTLDYTIQVAVSSLEPSVVKYGFMINGLKKEIQPIAVSFDSFKEAKEVLEGFLTEIDPVKMEEMFHEGRINVYKHAISSHEERLKEMKEDPEGAKEDAEIEMEKV